MNPFIDKGKYPSIRNVYCYQVFKDLILDHDCYFNNFLNVEKKDLITLMDRIHGLYINLNIIPIEHNAYWYIYHFIHRQYSSKWLLAPVTFKEILQATNVKLLLKYQFLTHPPDDVTWRVFIPPQKDDGRVDGTTPKDSPTYVFQLNNKDTFTGNTVSTMSTYRCIYDEKLRFSTFLERVADRTNNLLNGKRSRVKGKRTKMRNKYLMQAFIEEKYILVDTILANINTNVSNDKRFMFGNNEYYTKTLDSILNGTRNGLDTLKNLINLNRHTNTFSYSGNEMYILESLPKRVYCTILIKVITPIKKLIELVNKHYEGTYTINTKSIKGMIKTLSCINDIIKDGDGKDRYNALLKEMETTSIKSELY
jgi:hypothetical protein